jgi:hypothetical protein
MTRKPKLLTLSLVAVIALSAISASAAQAKAPEFHAEEAPVTYIGEQVETRKFVVDSGTVQCETATDKGMSEFTASTELEVETTFGGCTAFESEAKWSMNGCYYRSTMVVGSSPPTSVTDVVCPIGKEITITTPGCVIHVPPQLSVKHALWKSQGSGLNRDLTETITEEGITYTETSGCISPGKHTDGVSFGSITFIGQNSKGKQEGIWVE